MGAVAVVLEHEAAVIALLLAPLALLGFTTSEGYDDTEGGSWLSTVGGYALAALVIYCVTFAVLAYLGFFKLLFAAMSDAIKLARETVAGVVRAFL